MKNKENLELTCKILTSMLSTNQWETCRQPFEATIDFIQQRICCDHHLDDDDIIIPPCKVGDTVWRVDDVWHLDDKGTWTYHYEKEVVEYVVRSISISCNSKGKWTKKFRICEVRNGKIIDRQRDIEFDDFGKIVFPIREEAEIALMEALKNNGKEGVNT